MADNRPNFANAYLVARRAAEEAAGVVRRDRNVWRILRFGVPAEQQPKEAFATWEEAGARLIELASA